MRSRRQEDINNLRNRVNDEVVEIIGMYHAYGANTPIFPYEAHTVFSKAKDEHEEMLMTMKDMYGMSVESIEKERRELEVIEERLYDNWLNNVWLHNTSKKEVVLLLIKLIASHFDGRVYRSQLARYLYFITYRCLIKKGYSIADLVWHASEPRSGAVTITSRQIDLIDEDIAKSFTVSTPSMRSSYITTKEKPKKAAKDLDSMLGVSISEFIRDQLNLSSDSSINKTIPIRLWRAGYRPEGNRIMLEKAALWDEESVLSNVLSNIPHEMLSIRNE